MEPNELFNLIKALQLEHLRQTLFSDQEGIHKQLDLLKLFASHEDISRIEATDDLRRSVAYVLVDYEKTHRVKQELESSLNSALRLAVVQEDTVLVDVILQAGADMFAVLEGQTIYDFIMGNASQPVKDLVDKYFPGVWSAVESENISELRRLVNNWCSTDIYQEGVHLVDLALRGGHEPIIRLVTGVFWTMKLIRAVMAGNRGAVKELLDNQLKELQLDFRNMSENGAPILHFVIERGDFEMAKLLIDHGCRLFTLMRLKGDPSIEIPVLFTTLIEPTTKAALLEALLPKGKNKQEELLYRMLYQARFYFMVESSCFNPLSFHHFLTGKDSTRDSDRIWPKSRSL